MQDSIVKDSTTGLQLVPHRVTLARREADLILSSPVTLDPVVSHAGVWLQRWASEVPERTFLAERSGAGWRELAYAEVLQAVQAIAESLVARGLNQTTTIVIMSGNSVDHALLSLGAQYAGVPTVPLAEQYSLIPEARARLSYVMHKVKPVMAFVDDAERYAAALADDEFSNVEIVASRSKGGSPAVTAFSELLRGDSGVDLAAVHATVGPDTLAKVLFTSGSSSDPKGVLTTQRMMCTNQAQLASVLPFLKTSPPRIVDWLPWNHVFGGSHNFNMMLAQGGTLYIDDGKPTRSGFQRTVENITDKGGTLSFNVPMGFSMLVNEMRSNESLRQRYFEDLDMLFYAGASLPQQVWTQLEEMAMAVRGRLPLMISSWGMTETAPATLMLHEPIGRSGVVGVPLPGTRIKLLPDEDMRCELRVKGPNIMRGYWEDEDKSREAFDDEGYLVTGDAVRFVDYNDPERGLKFDGRVSEDFKLLTGTWVHAGRLRLEALEALRGLVQDVVITGHDREEVGLLIFVNPALKLPVDDSGEAVVDARLASQLQEKLVEFAKQATGSASRIARALVLAEPPSIEHHEITDKGSLNVRKIITRRAALIERLYDNDIQDPALIRV